ncbi:alpha/beta fold hydrolase [Williamsia deligens]
MAAAAVVSLMAIPAQALAAPNSSGGTDDPSCHPSAAHPRPVVLVHGTWSNPTKTWDKMAPALREQGYCVYTMSYGKRQPLSPQNLLDLFGGDSIRESAQTLGAFVAKVRSETGARQVDIVGHSQGAVVARQYMKFDGGTNRSNPSANAVNTLVSLAGTNHGTSFNRNQMIGAIGQLLGIPVVRLASIAVGPSYVEQMIGSPFLERLNAGGDTQPGVRYVVFGTRDDTMVTPPERTFLTAGPGAQVRNAWVQDGCRTAVVDHMGMTSDPRVIGLVLGALDPTWAATHPAPCP